MLKPDTSGWRWLQCDMSTAVVPDWHPCDLRSDFLSDQEIQEGVNITSLLDDETENPCNQDFAWLLRTSEADSASAKSEAAAIRALASALDSGACAEDAHAAAAAARSQNQDLRFVRWAYCQFPIKAHRPLEAGGFKLPETIISQLKDIPHETTVYAQYRLGVSLAISAKDAVRLFNTLCHIGPSLCLEPCVASDGSNCVEYSISVLKHEVVDEFSYRTLFLERAPDPHELRKMKIAQNEISALERQLMKLVSERAYAQRNFTGDPELSWGEVQNILVSIRSEEQHLRARVAELEGNHTQKKNSKQHLNSLLEARDPQREFLLQSCCLHDQLIEQHAELAPIVLLDTRLSDLRCQLERFSERASVQHVTLWSRWSPKIAAHTPAEPPLIGELRVIACVVLPVS
jgi:hypothetical protein